MAQPLHNRGFSLLELLLVLVCFAAIVSWCMHHYQQEQRRAQTAQVLSDIKTLQRALDSYFHITGCSQAGVFAGSSDIPCSSLQGVDSSVVCRRPPLIDQYLTKVVNTGKMTTGTLPKPIYRLEVQAQMSSSLTLDQVGWYRQELEAKSGSNSNGITWESLPTNTYVQLGDKSWILYGAGAFFRATENQRGSGAALPPTSGSFCAD